MINFSKYGSEIYLYDEIMFLLLVDIHLQVTLKELQQKETSVS